MTAAAAPARSAYPITPITFGRRVAVELRKLTDTRAGKGLLIAILAFIPLGMTMYLALPEEGETTTMGELLMMGLFLLTFLLPVLGIINIADEWRQKTVMSTYVLDPKRNQVLAAKAAAILILGFGILAVGVILAFGVSMVANIPIGDAGSLAKIVGGAALATAVYCLWGIGLGSAFVSAPIAIIVFFLGGQILPSILGNFGPLKDIAPYLDLMQPTQQFLSGVFPPADPVKYLTALTAWVIIPLVIGFYRNARTDIS